MRDLSSVITKTIVFQKLTQFSVFLFQPLYLHFKNCNLFMSIIGNKLKVFYTVVILNTVNMMNNLPSMKIATKVLRHYKAMLSDSSAIDHWKEKIARVQSDKNIASFFSFIASPFPPIVFNSISCIKLISTSIASKICWFATNKMHPSFFTAIHTSMPDRCSTIMSCMSSAFSQLWHDFIILYLHKVRKEEAN